jgi:hypothetical protein
MKFKLRVGFAQLGEPRMNTLWVATFDETQDWADFSGSPD